jgi:hypothetical protein
MQEKVWPIHYMTPQEVKDGVKLVFLYKGEHSKLLISILCKYDAGEWGEN